MGWKSTIELTREEAIDAILKSLDSTPYERMTNKELEDMMSSLNIGDDANKPYFGHNFSIIDIKKDDQRLYF